MEGFLLSLVASQVWTLVADCDQTRCAAKFEDADYESGSGFLKKPVFDPQKPVSRSIFQVARIHMKIGGCTKLVSLITPVTFVLRKKQAFDPEKPVFLSDMASFESCSEVDEKWYSGGYKHADHDSGDCFCEKPV